MNFDVSPYYYLYTGSIIFLFWITKICRVDKQSVIYRPGHFVYCGRG